MELHKIGIKLFVEDPTPVGLLEFIAVFHRWIQTRKLDDLLIDVADYSHVHAGPGIVLIAHEGNYAMDETGNRRGMVYYSKHPLDGSLPERLATVWRKTVKACQLLEKDREIEGRIQFRGDQLEIYANDRLIAPNSEETFEALRPALVKFLACVAPDRDYQLSREPDPKERFAVTVQLSEPIDINTSQEQAAAIKG